VAVRDPQVLSSFEAERLAVETTRTLADHAATLETLGGGTKRRSSLTEDVLADLGIQTTVAEEAHAARVDRSKVVTTATEPGWDDR
jgi:hypothetical protein